MYSVFLRLLPARYITLASAGNLQFLLWDIFGDGRACTNGGASANRNGCYQGTVGANKHAITQHRLKLVHAIVVAGDCACTHVHAGTQRSIADVAQVVNFAALPQNGFFSFNKITHFGVGRQLCTRAQARKRSDLGVFTHAGLLDHAVSVNLRAVGDGRIGYYTAGADRHVADQGYLTDEHNVDINQYVITNAEFATHVN